MDITSPAGVELMLKRTPGATTVVSGAVTTYGQVKYGDEEGFEGGELTTVVRVRTVLVATGILPNQQCHRVVFFTLLKRVPFLSAK